MTNNEWHTPVDLVADLQRAVGGKFDVDPASGCEPEPIAKTAYTKEDDGLTQPWFGHVFTNPPYDRTIADWMERAHEQAQRDRVDSVTALIPVRSTTQWWHNHVHAAEHICLIEGRLKFGGASNNARFPCALVVWGEPEDLPERLETVLKEWGKLYEPREVPSLADAWTGAELEIELDERSHGFPESVEATAYTRVLTGDVTEDGMVELLTVQPEPYGDKHETYYLLTFPRSDYSDVRCSVENSEIRGWRDVHLNSVEMTDNPAGPDPFAWVA